MNNSWTGRERKGVLTPKMWLPDDDQAAVLQMTVVDPEIGNEVVLALKDSHPKAQQYFQSQGLWLNLKAGLFETSYGAIIYMAWLLPSERHRHSPVMYGDLANPNDPACIPLLELAGEQSHLHVLLFGENNRFIRAMEVPNVFRLGDLAEAARASADEMPVTDYEAAQAEFNEQFDPQVLLGSRAA